MYNTAHIAFLYMGEGWEGCVWTCLCAGSHTLCMCTLYINGPVPFLSTVLWCTHIQHTLTHEQTCTCIAFDSEAQRDTDYILNLTILLHLAMEFCVSLCLGCGRRNITATIYLDPLIWYDQVRNLLLLYPHELITLARLRIASLSLYPLWLITRGTCMGAKVKWL